MKFYVCVSVISSLLLLYACGTDDQNSGNTEIKKRDFSTEMYPDCWINEQTLEKNIVHSGKYASHIDSAYPFSYGFCERIGNIDDMLPKKANIKVWVLYRVVGTPADLVFSIDSVQKNKFWIGIPLKDSVIKANEWTEIKCQITLPGKISPEDKIGIYVWGKAKKELYIDDLSISFEY